MSLDYPRLEGVEDETPVVKVVESHSWYHVEHIEHIDVLPVIDPSLMDANPKFPYFTEDSSRLENLMDRNRQRADRVAGIVTTDVVIKNLEMEALIKLLNQTFPHAFDEIGMYWWYPKEFSSYLTERELYLRDKFDNSKRKWKWFPPEILDMLMQLRATHEREFPEKSSTNSEIPQDPFWQTRRSHR